MTTHFSFFCDDKDEIPILVYLYTKRLNKVTGMNYLLPVTRFTPFDVYINFSSSFLLVFFFRNALLVRVGL